MKQIITTLALLAVVATPAFAQTTKHQVTRSVARTTVGQAYEVAPIGTNNLNRYSSTMEAGASIGPNSTESEAFLSH
jgi:hypothetical protein